MLNEFRLMRTQTEKKMRNENRRAARNSFFFFAIHSPKRKKTKKKGKNQIYESFCFLFLSLAVSNASFFCSFDKTEISDGRGKVRCHFDFSGQMKIRK